MKTREPIKLPIKVSGFTKTAKLCGMIHGALEEAKLPVVTIQSIGNSSAGTVLKALASFEDKKGVNDYYYSVAWNVLDLDGVEKTALVTIVSKYKSLVDEKRKEIQKMQK